MEKMIKETIAVRVNPATKKKLEQMRSICGLSYGCLFDKLVSEFNLAEMIAKSDKTYLEHLNDTSDLK